MTQLPLPLVRERVFFIGGRSWRSRWLSDVDDAVVTRPDASAAADHAQHNDAAGEPLQETPTSAAPPLTLRPRVCAALEPWIQAIERAETPDEAARPFRAHLDPGGAALGAVLDPESQLLWLGSPRFALERHLYRMMPNCGAEPFATAWLQADASATPLDIDVATIKSGLANLRQPDTNLAAALTKIHALSAELGTELHTAMARYRPSLMERFSQWGLGLQADFPVLRVHVLRFVALLPSLDHDQDGTSVSRLLSEMMRRTLADSKRARSGGRHRPLPWWLDLAFSVGGVATQLLPNATVAWLTRAGVRRLAGIFIAGETIQSAAGTLDALRASSRGATVDQLGELVVSEREADRYRDEVLALVAGVADQYGDARNGAGVPLAHVSVKVSALCAHYDADDLEGTWSLVGPRLGAILSLAQRRGVFVHIDAEHYAVRDLTLQVLRRALRASDTLWTWADVGIVVQAYLRDAPSHLADVLQLCADRATRMPLRLVKGAYWDAETTEANAHGYDAPQWLNKPETDLCFQQLTLEVLRNGELAQLCIGSHNLRDHCFARAARTTLYPSAPPIEHQALHATYEALSTGMAHLGWAVRNYIPVGSLLVGMAYLVRRVMENSSQVGVLTMARGAFSLGETLRTPAQTLEDAFTAGERMLRPTQDCDDARPGFVSLAPVRLYRPTHRAEFQSAVERQAWVLAPDASPRERARQGRSGPVVESVNPSNLSHVVGRLQTCTSADVAPAVERAAAAQTAWQSAGAGARAALLLRAGERMAARRDDFAVLVASEAGKSRREALGDVDEAVDFLRFYGVDAYDRETKSPSREARGVIAVIAPWNFPLAIPCGMAAAALATGNTAVLKSAEQTPLVVEALIDLFHEVGIPTDVIQHLPGEGATVGAALVAHPKVAGCVFTGSKAVGTLLHSQLAAANHRTAAGADSGKMIITEMGGKNAVIITDNADIDQAIDATLKAAFAHAGQKCSAASRLLVDARVFDSFTTRFAKAAADLVVGDALTAGVHINAVISADEQTRLCVAQEAAAAECMNRGGKVLLAGGRAPGPGSAVLPAVFQLPVEAADHAESLSRRELFGPVIHALPYHSLEEAVALFNGTEYALTGGVFAQSDDDIDALLPHLRCGNLYINRSNTGARVAIESFGGFAMSGTGPKAGGRDYLEAFLAPISERAALAMCGDTPIAVAPQMAADDTSAPTLGTAQAPTWPLALVCGDARSAATRATRLAATLGTEAGDDRGAWLDKLTKALPDLAQMRDVPEVTHAIAGQETHEHRAFGRGPTVILAARPRPGPTGLAHLVAALATGAPTLVVALSDSAAAWQVVVDAAQTAGVPSSGIAMVTAQTRAEAAAWALVPSLATWVIDGPRTPWSGLLGEALHRRRLSAVALPHVWCTLDGPSLGAPRALLRRHLLVRTVAVNTMRHGAPLSLES